MDWRSSLLKKKQYSEKKRITVLAVFFIIFSLCIVARLFTLQIIRGGFYSALAAGQHDLYQKLFPERGSIYVSESTITGKTLFPLVTNQKLNMLYAVPVSVEDASSTADKLFGILGLSDGIKYENLSPIIAVTSSSSTVDDLMQKNNKTQQEQWFQEQKSKELVRLTGILSQPNKLYAPIRSKLSDKQVEAIKALNIKGLEFKEEDWRFYPEQGMGGHIFGFWGFSGDSRKGKYGLESYFDSILSGTMGEIHSERDAWGNIVAVGNNSIKEKTDGQDLVLTIDRAIQFKTCQELYLMVQGQKAKGGSAIVMDPKTGAILAMCSYPDYSPDKYNQVDNISVYNNPAIFEAYEPGSVFKPITMAAALDVGKVKPDTTYVDTGVVDYGKYKIGNYNDKSYGLQTMTQVLETSINTGVIYAMQQATQKVFVNYVKNFGFGVKTGIELDKEMPGDISNLNLRGEINAATATFGQGITVTPLQMITAVGAIANGGKLMHPYIVSQILSGKEVVSSTQPKVLKQVVSSKTAMMLSGMMVSVTENGHAKTAQIPGYHVAGKTGTAQVPKNGGGYMPDSVVNASFIGYAPFTNPKFVMFVVIKEPQYGKTGEYSAAPVFANVGKFILQYYNVPYDRADDPALKK
ncbi:MAG: penicillin-binding protein 2 [Patescibacteria group bacterium]|jgi:cell division protein FtsI/penicillin-binding protein 2